MKLYNVQTLGLKETLHKNNRPNLGLSITNGGKTYLIPFRTNDKVPGYTLKSLKKKGFIYPVPCDEKPKATLDFTKAMILEDPRVFNKVGLIPEKRHLNSIHPQQYEKIEKNINTIQKRFNKFIGYCINKEYLFDDIKPTLISNYRKEDLK